MKLQDLDLDLAGVVSAPLMRDKPEPDWIQGKESGVVPSQLFNLYESGSYLSFGSAPKFLSDKDNLLFSYFAMLLRSLKQQLQDGPRLLVELREAHAVMYDPVKKAKGIPWDPDADDRAQRAFRELIVRAYSALDVIAELAALLFTDGIPQLPVGRAQFGAIEDWLRTPMSLPNKPTPYEALLGELHGRLQPLVLSAGPEEDWVRLLRLLRNKAAHLGNDAFRFFGLLGPDEQLYFFVPREWPHFFEQNIGPVDKNPSQTIKELFIQTLMHEDYIAFVSGLNRKILAVTDVACDVLNRAYKLLAEGAPNQRALKELRKNLRAFAFRHFAEPDAAAG